jgi:S1-C subfamily serine protease
MGIVGAVGGPLSEGRSALERFIRTDAIPYPGFSGGPLVDVEGCIVGMNTSGVIPGVSLAIPAATAWSTARALQQYGRIRRGYLGVRSQAVELPASQQASLGRSQATGLLMVGIERGQPADSAGMMVGDILVGLEGRPIPDHDSLLEQLAGDVAGRVVEAEILRGGRPVRLPIHLAE